MLNIKSLREELNLTQKEFAERINTTNKNIWAYENGLAQPSIELLIKMATVFNVSVDYLIGRTDEDGIVKKNETQGLTKREQKLLQAFMQLDFDEQNKIIADCEYFANKKIKTQT